MDKALRFKQKEVAGGGLKDLSRKLVGSTSHSANVPVLVIWGEPLMSATITLYGTKIGSI